MQRLFVNARIGTHDLASRLAAAAIEEEGAEAGDAEAVAGAVRAANARIFERSLTDPAVAGMGTTATVALVDEHAGTLTLAHVGDSRGYRYREGVLQQLTTDHSLVAELVRTGRLTEAEAAVHPHRSVITRALGTEAEVEVDTRTLELAPGDLVLLCSDGLSAMVRDDEIARLLGDSDLDPYQAAETLVRAANAAGGEDNVTVVVFEVIEGTPRTTQPAAQEGAPAAGPDDVTSESALDGVQRHGAGKGSRWPALLLVLAILAVAALAIWWTFLR